MGTPGQGGGGGGDDRRSPHANELELAQDQWLPAIGRGNHQQLHEWPVFLRNLTNFSGGGGRVKLRNAIEQLASGVTEELCYPPDGL
jgi:hypothetical protein